MAEWEVSRQERKNKAREAQKPQWEKQAEEAWERSGARFMMERAHEAENPTPRLTTVVLCGLPGSGKSLLAAQLKQKGFFVVCQDDLGSRAKCEAKARRRRGRSSTGAAPGRAPRADRPNTRRVPFATAGPDDPAAKSSRPDDSPRRRGRRVDRPRTGHGAAADETWMVRGLWAAAKSRPRAGSSADGSRRRRGRESDRPNTRRVPFAAAGPDDPAAGLGPPRRFEALRAGQGHPEAGPPRRDRPLQPHGPAARALAQAPRGRARRGRAAARRARRALRRNQPPLRPGQRNSGAAISVNWVASTPRPWRGSSVKYVSAHDPSSRGDATGR